MFQLFANIFGYLLQLIYSLINNYGLAIIIFTVVIKILLLPLSIKQQKSFKKNAELQERMKIIQFKYKSDPEKMNQEIMNLYKQENMNPFAGCLTAIIQMVLLISIFYMVRMPLTYMQKIPAENINTYINQLKDGEKTVSEVYPQIDIIREYEYLKQKSSENPEAEDTQIDKVNIQMDLFGLDLSKIPQENMADYTVYIIPVLYILSSFISIRLSTKMQEKQQKEAKQVKTEVIEPEGKELVPQEDNEMEAIMQTNKMMSWMMPILSISIAFVAPLGLALYWLMNNILMIIERVILDKVIKA